MLYSGSTKLSTTTSTFKKDTSLHVQYRSHVQNVGWQSYVKDGATSGTSGKSLRVEAMNISLINAPSGGKIVYRTHVQNVGWQSWKSDGAMTGTTGKSRRIEAIQIKLENMDAYTVEYRVHVQNVGWTGWYIDGETAGTTGKSLRIEAIQIRIVSKYKRSYKGIDVSQFNGTVNWTKVKSAGMDFAFVRAGYRGYGSAGTLVTDSKFATNMSGAINAGLNVGVYFVTQATSDSEAIEEANYVINLIKNYDISYPVAIDIEYAASTARTNSLTKEARTRYALKFCQKIAAAGYTPVVYCNVDWATNYLNMSTLSSYDTWIAHYTTASKPSYTGTYKIWQYSDTGSVNGVIGNVDLDISYKKYK